MKKINFIGAFAIIMLLSSCGGSDCYLCRRNSHWDGMEQTAPGDWGINCQEDGESDAAFEARIKEKTADGYTCKPD